MNIGVALPSGDTGDSTNIVETLIEQTQEAASFGIDSAWYSQMFQHDAITIAALAGRAEPRIAVGTSVVPLYPRPPLLLSSAAKTAQAATNGRFTLGVGLGAQRILEPAYGVPYPQSIRHLREQLTVLRQLFADETVDFVGETTSARPGLSTIVAGARPDVPILVAAMGPRALRATGELADGTIPLFAGPRTLGEFIVPTITAAADRAGRKAPRIVAAVPAVVTSEIDTARAKAVEQFGFYDSIPSYAKVIEREGVAATHELAIFGTEETVARQVKDYFAAGASEVVLTQTGMVGTADRLRTWQLAGELARDEGAPAVTSVAR